MLKISLTNWSDKLVVNFYWIIMIGYILAVFIPQVSIVVLSSALLLVMFLAFINKNHFAIKKEFIYIYIIYIGLSFVSYMLTNIDKNLYFVGMAYSLLPIVMYLVPKNEELFMRRTFMAILFSLLVGLGFYLWAPDFYGVYLANHNYLRYSYQVKTSFQGLYGITTLGTYSACSTIYFYGQWLEANRKMDFFAMLFSVAILIFTMRRSAVAACAVIFVVENIAFWNKSVINKKKQLFVMLFLLVTLLFLVFFPNAYMSALYSRVMDISSAVSERSGNWSRNLEIINEHFLFGTGIGSGGHMASAAGYIGVHDNSYLLIISELGIVGLIIFILIYIKDIFSFILAPNKSIDTYTAFFVSCIFIIQAIGSNVWEFPLLGALFWGCLSCLKKR